jgi:hypothetical protein
VKVLISRTLRLLAILPLAALAAENNTTNPPSVLPEPVAAAITAGDCEQLTALNKRYHADPAAAARDAAIRALEDAILALPTCGRIGAALVRVEPIEGIDFFDRRSPLGASARSR